MLFESPSLISFKKYSINLIQNIFTQVCRVPLCFRMTARERIPQGQGCCGRIQVQDTSWDKEEPQAVEEGRGEGLW